MNLNDYISEISKFYSSGRATEHTYRGTLTSLIESINKEIDITNEPKGQECGNPDYVLTKGKIPIGYIEAKDVGKDLNSEKFEEQFSRYKKALDNLIITDYLWFQFFQNGELIHEIRIGEIENGEIKAINKNYVKFVSLIKDFTTFIGQTIRSSRKLAEMMAAKARLLQIILHNSISSDEESRANTSLKDQYETFKDILIHDLKPKDFADIYAQTLAYGMFAARLHDKTLDTFSRQEAAELIPKTNPFLRRLFGYIAGPDIDERLKPTVDNLADVFRATNVDALLHNFGRSTQTNDPIIHFYETFLAEYDPKLRKARGVWYTPEPVVNFIVRAVDEILKNEFNLPQGLADTSKVIIEENIQAHDGRRRDGIAKRKKEVHKVQILDPATGTGTFLAEVIKFIYYKKFKAIQGAWSAYVEDHLIPRLNGFELLMASYSMAHLKLDMLLAETGFKAKKEQRFNIFLTNSLEAEHPHTGTIFSSWLSDEANEANSVKRDTPVMCIIGNPPYSGESVNKGDWIMELMNDYKKEPGGKIRLQERNPKWINDDYVKFLRYGQHYVEKNGEGILAFINPHGFLYNPTFRGMRWNLLKTYDKIYAIDLHGNSKKKEVSPDGSPDKNVFDIQQGVSINFFVKTGKKKTQELGKIFHYDLYGTRDNKYDFLWKNDINSVAYNQLPNLKPNYFFVPKDFKTEGKYNEGFFVDDLFTINSAGIVTARDKLTIKETKEVLVSTINDFAKLEIEDARIKYSLGKDVRDWKINLAQEDLKRSNLSEKNICKISYRLFDEKWTYYTGKSKGFHCRPRGAVMQHFFKRDNLGITLCKQFKTGDQYVHCFIADKIIESSYVSNRTSEITSIFPLYIYPSAESDAKLPNLNEDILKDIIKKLKLKFTPEKEAKEHTFAPIDILDYIYAVLHSPNYREKYKEFLKINFPRVPYPKDQITFWQLVKLGKQIREIHLLESSISENYITTYPIDGDHLVSRKMTEASIGFELTDQDNQLGKVWINNDQYFDKVPLKAWEFYIGGYQPAQKWLKDRKGRTLTFDDILHYQKIIVALTETDRLMNEIDKIDFM